MAQSSATTEIYKEPSLIVDPNFSKNNLGIGGDKFTQFNRFRLTSEADYSTSGISYVFFTKPHLNIKKQPNTYDSFINSLKNAAGIGAKITNSLDGKNSSEGTNFIALLTNSVESFDTKDTTIDTEEVADNFLGDKMILPMTTISSVTADNFSVEYNEYSDLSIMLLHKVWVDYMHLVKRGSLSPYKDDKIGLDYIKDKIIDYVSSVYYFRMAEDGQKIKYFSKYTGVFPTNVPYSAMSFHLGDTGVKKVTIQYAYSFKEDMKLEILDDFQSLCSNNVISHSYDTIKDNWKGYVNLSNDRTKLYFG